jgi:plastocyanin
MAMAAIALERRLAGMSWTRLLRVAGVAQCIGLGVAALILGDAEAAAIGVATLVGFFLLRFRGGTIGTLILTLVFADTGFFTGAAALTNLIDRSEPVFTIGPGALAAIALPGLVAAIVCLLRRGRAAAPSRLAVAASLLAVAAFAAVSIAAFAVGPEVSAAGSALQLEMKNVSYSTAQLEAARGTVTVRVTNHDLFWHTFTIPELGVDLKVPVGGRKEITFNAPPGDYTYLCSVPGHAAQMHGTLTVR